MRPDTQSTTQAVERSGQWDPPVRVRTLAPEAAGMLPGSGWFAPADTPATIARRAVRDTIDALPRGRRLADALLAVPVSEGLWPTSWEASITVNGLERFVATVRNTAAVRAAAIVRAEVVDQAVQMSFDISVPAHRDILGDLDRTRLAATLAGDDFQNHTRLAQMVAALRDLAHRGVKPASAGELLRLRISLVDSALGAAAWTEVGQKLTDLDALTADEVFTALSHLRSRS